MTMSAHIIIPPSEMAVVNKKKVPAPLRKTKITGAPSALGVTLDSAVDMTFPPSIFDIGSKSPAHIKGHFTPNLSPITNAESPTSTQYGFATVEGMPFNYEQIIQMGDALAKARREKTFPNTITPSYNMQAIIDDYADLVRLNTAREREGNRDHASSPEISRLYIAIQRRIQDRDLTHGEVAADANVRARIGGLANGASAETGMYNLMRHAVQSVLRLNNLTLENEDNLVDAKVTRIVDTIRTSVQDQAAHGAHGVTKDNMEDVMEQVFGAIEEALGNRVESQATRLDANANRFDDITTAQSTHVSSMNNITAAQTAQVNNMNNITAAQTAQVNAIAGHVNAIDNHVHAMGNNVNAMSSLVNSTNGNVTALSANITTLQTVLNMMPQIVSQVAEDKIGEMLPGIIGPAVEEAFERAISNELLTRMQNFATAVKTAQVCAKAANNTPADPPKKKKSGRRNWFRFFRR